MKILFTIGDVNGIGLEVLIKSIMQNLQWLEQNSFAIVANAVIMEYFIKKYYTDWCEIKDNCIIFNKNSNCKMEIIEIKNFDVLHIIKELKNNQLEFYSGKISKTAGIIALNSIIEATQLTLANEFDAIVTLPISKSAIHLYRKNFIGHTEIITELCNKKQSIMILFTNELRVALATIHIPVFKISKQITSKKLRTLFKNFNSTLKYDFGIKQPNIAVLGLNPHASDNGMFGKEETNIIIPAIEIMKKKGLNIDGTFSADGFFASKNYIKYDGVVAMYHDQGLIPLKILSNGKGVNFTANLPIVRTSPDHGTAFEIAGKKIANSQSMQDAINAAIDIAKNRHLK